MSRHQIIVEQHYSTNYCQNCNNILSELDDGENGGEGGSVPVDVAADISAGSILTPISLMANTLKWYVVP